MDRTMFALIPAYEPTISTSDYYSDGEVTIQLTTYRREDTDIYVADIVLASPDSLKTAFAKNTYGKNVTEHTSEIAAAPLLCILCLSVDGRNSMVTLIKL